MENSVHTPVTTAQQSPAAVSVKTNVKSESRIDVNYNATINIDQ